MAQIILEEGDVFITEKPEYGMFIKPHIVLMIRGDARTGFSITIEKSMPTEFRVSKVNELRSDVALAFKMARVIRGLPDKD